MKHLTRDELRALLTVAKAHSERDHLMILTGFWHGLRCSEIVKMRGTQIRDGHLTVQRLKGSLKTTLTRFWMRRQRWSSGPNTWATG